VATALPAWFKANSTVRVVMRVFLVEAGLRLWGAHALYQIAQSCPTFSFPSPICRSRSSGLVERWSKLRCSGDRSMRLFQTNIFLSSLCALRERTLSVLERLTGKLDSSTNGTVKPQRRTLYAHGRSPIIPQ